MATTVRNGYKTPSMEMNIPGTRSVNMKNWVYKQELFFTMVKRVWMKYKRRTKWRFAWFTGPYKSLTTPCLYLTNNTHLLESILRFLKVSHCDNETSAVNREVECYTWFPGDDRKSICNEALEYLTKGLLAEGIKLKHQFVDLSHFDVEFPVLILCFPPSNPGKVSIGDMPVSLFILHHGFPLERKDDSPMADDLFWRRYQNLSIISDLWISDGIVGDVKDNADSVYKLRDFVKTML